MISQKCSKKFILNTSLFFVTGDQSYEKKTLLFLLLASVRVSVQMFMLGLAILFIFDRTIGQN